MVGAKSDPKKLYGGFGLIRIPTDPTGRATGASHLAEIRWTNRKIDSRDLGQRDHQISG